MNFLPEIILAYLSVLLVAGQYVSRDNVLESMNLAVKIGESDALTEVFVRAGLMRELVNALAIMSRAVLKANENSKEWKFGRGKGRRRGRGRAREERTDLWSIPIKKE